MRHAALAALLLAPPALGCSPPAASPLPVLQTIRIGSSSLVSQQLPLSMCRAWPVWMAVPDGSAVTRVPSAAAADRDGVPKSWVDPITFDEMWLPTDLPLPSLRAAVGCVLKDGTPRYLFPCLEASVATGPLVWHNRGLNSLPLGSTWLPWGDVPVDSLRLSGWTAAAPPLKADSDSAAPPSGKDGADAA